MFEEDQICPYTGLRSFTEEESLYFKGREDDINQATEQLQKNKFLMHIINKCCFNKKVLPSDNLLLIIWFNKLANSLKEIFIKIDTTNIFQSNFILN